MYPLSRTFANVQRMERLVDWRRGLFFDGQKFQTFVLSIRNTGGTLEHTISADGYPVVNNGLSHAPAYADMLMGINPSTFPWANTPTVSNVVAFVNGGGILSGTANVFLLHTRIQDPNKAIGWTGSTYYDGNVNRVRVTPVVRSDDINGAAQYRLGLHFTLDLTGAVWNINTTNIPSGKYLITRVTAALQ